MKDKIRLLELDVFRGIAALYVVFFHYAAYYGDSVNPSAPELSRFITGIYGIQLFYMISGFVIFMTLEKTKHPLDFIVSRFSRLFPGYWLAVLLAFVSLRIFDYTGQGAPLRRTIANLTMLQGWAGINHVDGVYWTLSVELAFYCIMFLLFITRMIRHLEIFGSGWLVWMTLCSQGVLPYPRVMDLDNLLRYGHLFFAGIIFYKLKTQGGSMFRYFCLALCLGVQYMVKIEIHHRHYLDPVVGTLMVFLFFSAFHLFISGKLALITSGPMVFLGAISYSLYLTHQSVSCIIMQTLYVHQAPMVLVFAVPLACSILLAAAITYGVEKPAMEYIRSIYKKWQSANSQRKLA